jgi:hypothetical protein
MLSKKGAWRFISSSEILRAPTFHVEPEFSGIRNSELVHRSRFLLEKVVNNLQT